MVRNRFCGYVVPYDVNVTDVNVTQSIFFELVFMLCHMM